ncbi:MAG TPA: AMP-binding protein, partial [Pseudomonadales bacterium]|nr:AMP-binding protein [Pseudomonadales bacterium]
MNSSANTAASETANSGSKSNLKPREVNLINVIRGATAIMPNIGTTLKGLGALISAKPHKKNSIGLLLEKRAAAQPNHIAVRYQDQTLTYRELNEQANRIAHYLMTIGITTGDSVGIMFDNRPETLVTVMATVKLGAIASMINTSQRSEVLAHSINLTNPKAIFVGEEVLDNMSTVEDSLSDALKENIFYIKDEGNIPCPALYKDLEKEIVGQPSENPVTTKEVKLHQPCYYIFTSGTTGLPKASVMTHYRWFKSMAGMGLA